MYGGPSRAGLPLCREARGEWFGEVTFSCAFVALADGWIFEVRRMQNSEDELVQLLHGITVGRGKPYGVDRSYLIVRYYIRLISFNYLVVTDDNHYPRDSSFETLCRGAVWHVNLEEINVRFRYGRKCDIGNLVHWKFCRGNLLSSFTDSLIDRLHLQHPKG